MFHVENNVLLILISSYYICNIVKSNHLYLYIYGIFMLLLLVLLPIVYIYICSYFHYIFICVLFVCSSFITLHTTLCGVDMHIKYIYMIPQ